MTTTEPAGVTSPREAGIDWARTTAWGEGGYYARVFLNVEGREPEGTVPAGRLRAGARRPRPPARGDPRRRTATRSRRAPTGPRSSTTRSKGVAPDLIVDLRRPALALGRDDRRRRGRPHVRERHRPRRREPRPGRAVDRRRRGRRGARHARRAPARRRADRARPARPAGPGRDARHEPLAAELGAHESRRLRQRRAPHRPRRLLRRAPHPHADDRRARGGGVRFDQAIAAAPWTCPSTTSMITGLYPHHHGYLHWDATLDPALPTLFTRRRRPRLRDRQLRLRRELPLQGLPRRERRRHERDARRRRRVAARAPATRRSCSGSTAGRRTCPTTCSTPSARSGSRRRRQIIAGIQSDSAAALEELREAYAGAVERSSEVLLAGVPRRARRARAARRTRRSRSSPTTASRGASASPTSRR